MFNLREFEHILRKDEAPREGAVLRKKFEENPKLLLEEVGDSFTPKDSVIFQVIYLGNLNLADCILKSNGYNFISNADPFYLGKECLDFCELPESAGVNFYLALITWQFYSQKNKLTELANNTTLQEIVIKQTYYEKFYWENEQSEACYTYNESNSSERCNFMRTQAEWFMRFAYEVFQLEEQLQKTLLSAESSWNKLSSLFFPSDDKAREIYAILADYYLHIAYMEIRSEKACFYFINKANDYYIRSSKDGRNVPNKLSKLVTSNPDRTWLEIAKSQFEPLRNCGIATRDYSISAADAWSKAFNYAHQKIMDQDIPSSLHFMNTDSNRTSLNSQSSDELHETKQSNSEIVNLGLHRRKNMVENPLLKSSTSMNCLKTDF